MPITLPLSPRVQLGNAGNWKELKKRLKAMERTLPWATMKADHLVPTSDCGDNKG